MQTFLILGVAALVTWFTRALPFMLFKGKELPATVLYLGKVLPPAIMMVLVYYCLRNISFTSGTYGIPEVVSVIGIILIHHFGKNMYVSIVAGTLCYMALIRIM